MKTIEKNIDPQNKVIFDVEESDHGNSGMQWYYGYLETPDTTHEFSISVMHESNSGSYSEELTWVDDAPDNAEFFETEIFKLFDWSEINDEHEQNQIELERQWIKFVTKIGINYLFIDMKTPKEFANFFQKEFINDELGKDIEMHLNNVLVNRGKFRAYYGKDNYHDRNYVKKPYFIEIVTKCYRYEAESIRNIDLETLKIAVVKFRTENGLPNDEPVYIN